MDLWDVHYKSTNNEGSIDAGAFHIHESEDHEVATSSVVHAIADKSFAGVLCSSPTSWHENVSPPSYTYFAINLSLLSRTYLKCT